MLNCKRLPVKRVYDCEELDYMLEAVEAVDDFVLNIYALAELRCALKNMMNEKTSSNQKEFSHRQKKINEQYIQQLLTFIPTDPFDGPARNIMSRLEISSKIIDGLLAVKETSFRTCQKPSYFP